MTRAIIKLKDGTYINIPGDYLLRGEDGLLTAWNGNDVVAMVRMDLVAVAYLTEKGIK